MSPIEYVTSQLADTLAMPVTRFIEIFGAPWVENWATPWHDFDSDPSGGLGGEVTPWHIAGDPPQLMVRVFHHGVFIAAPHGVWSGVAELEYQPRDQVYVGADDLPTRGTEVVKSLLTSRRRSFRYCRYCLRSTPPEERVADDTCNGCASRHEGIVF